MTNGIIRACFGLHFQAMEITTKHCVYALNSITNIKTNHNFVHQNYPKKYAHGQNVGKFEPKAMYCHILVLWISHLLFLILSDIEQKLMMRKTQVQNTI